MVFRLKVRSWFLHRSLTSLFVFHRMCRYRRIGTAPKRFPRAAGVARGDCRAVEVLASWEKCSVSFWALGHGPVMGLRQACAALQGKRVWNLTACFLPQASVCSVKRQLCFLHAWQPVLKWRPLLMCAALSCTDWPLPAGEAGGVPKPLHRRCSHGGSAGVLNVAGSPFWSLSLGRRSPRKSSVRRCKC